MGRTAATRGPASSAPAEQGRKLFLNKFLAAEITTTVRNIKIEVPLSAADGMPKLCAVNCDNLRTISKQALLERIAILPTRRIVEVKRAMGYPLGWDELIDALP